MDGLLRKEESRSRWTKGTEPKTLCLYFLEFHTYFWYTVPWRHANLNMLKVFPWLTQTGRRLYKRTLSKLTITYTWHRQTCVFKIGWQFNPVTFFPIFFWCPHIWHKINYATPHKITYKCNTLYKSTTKIKTSKINMQYTPFSSKMNPAILIL